MKTRENTAALRRIETTAPRPEETLRRYRMARERLEARRRERSDRFAYLRRGHD